MEFAKQINLFGQQDLDFGPDQEPLRQDTRETESWDADPYIPGELANKTDRYLEEQQ